MKRLSLKLFCTSVILPLMLATVASCGVVLGLDQYGVVDCANCADGANNAVDGSSASIDGATDVGATGDAPSGADVIVVDAGPPNPIFVASKQEIWRFDVVTKQVAPVITNVDKCSGDFQSLVMTTAGKFIVGTSGLNPTLSSIAFDDAGVAFCEVINKKNYDDALTFVPPGVLGASEVIAGYDKASDYIRVDETSGLVTVLTPDPLSPREWSGDLAAHGNVGYLSAQNGDCVQDCLLEVDLATGRVTKRLGEFPEKDVLGLAYVRGQLYGFAKSGNIYVVQINPFAILHTIPAQGSRPEWGPATSLNEP